MKRIFIVNPTAGNGKALKVGKALFEICESEGLDYEIVYTKTPGSAKKIAQQHRSNFGETIVYSVGGDGTLNEVVNGIVNSGSVLGIIPAGTGNDFSKIMNKTIRTNNSGIERIDIGKVNERYFINVASLGIDAKVAKRANQLKEKSVPSSLVYYLSALIEAIKLESIKLKVDGKKDFKNFTMLAVCNGAYYGGGIAIAPNASINDGVFDVYEVPNINRLQLLKLFSLLLKHRHGSSGLINYWKTDFLEVESLVPLLCNIDGEIIEDRKFKFENIEGGLYLLYKDHPKIMALQKKMLL